MGIVGWGRNRKGKNRGSRKAISTIMANLTMLVIVVSLSSLLFVWATASFGAYTGGAGYWFSSRSIANQERISVENAFFGGSGNNVLTLYVRNVGTIPFTIASVYVNATQYNTSTTVLVNQAASMQVFLTTGTWTHGAPQAIKVATLRGTTVSTSWVS